MATTLTIVELEDLLGPRLHDAEVGAGPPIVLERRYHLLKIVGRGARGIVCKSRDVRLDRQVAVKLYPAEPSLVREVEREAKALARLDHPNVVGVHDAGYTDVDLGEHSVSCLLLVMDYVEGGTLRRWLRAEPRSTVEILTRFLAVGDGLAAAHQAGFIHRDLKPENVMIDTHGVCRLVDFGLARQVGGEAPRQAEPEERHTGFGGITGTLEYMAPEARAGKATAASDQFSLAVAIWEALAGSLPFDPQRGEWRLGNSDDFTGAADIPAPLAAVLRRSLSYDPAARYPSIRAFVDALTAVGLPRRRFRPPVLGIAASVGLLGAAAAYVVPLWLADADALESPDGDAVDVPAPPVLEIAQQPAPAPTPTRMDDPPPPTPSVDCPDLAGTWSFTTLATWAQREGVQGARGFYRLDTRMGPGCAVEFTLSKLGDTKVPRYEQPWEDRLHLSPRRGAGGELWYDGRFELSPGKLQGTTDSRARAYQFHFVVRDNGLGGDFESYGGDQPDLRGLLRGKRGRDDAVGPHDTDDGPCESRCRLRCPAAAASCIATACRTARGIVTGCPS